MFTPAGTASVITVLAALATGPLLLTWIVYVNVPPAGAVATLAVFTTTRFGWLESVTVTVLVQRAGSGAIQPGSPLVTLAVLATLVVEVLVALRVTTVWLAAPAATPAAFVQLIVAGPVAVVGVHTQPAPLVRPVMFTPAGTASVMTVLAALAPSPPLLT